MWYSMKHFLRTWSSPLVSWLKSQEWLKTEILWGWGPIRFLGMEVCQWELRKMPESVVPNPVKYNLSKMPKDPCVLHWDQGGQGPISRHQSLDWLTWEYMLKGRYLNHISAEDIKMLLAHYTILYHHNCKNNHTETRIRKEISKICLDIIGECHNR